MDLTAAPMNSGEAVLAAIEHHRAASVELLEELVRINSVNVAFPGVEVDAVKGGESRCADILEERFLGAGCETERVAPDPARSNLVAVRRGKGGGRSLILNGHVDTVPPVRPASWAAGSPWTPMVRDGRLYGLGATDMKGALVAQWLVASALADAGIELAGDLIFQCVVGEETWEHELGTTACVQAGFGADAAIVLEPSSLPRPLTVCVVSAGLWALKITVEGKSTHAGNRPLAIRPGGLGDAIGVNALEKGIKVVQALQELELEWGITKNHPLFPPGFFNLLPGVFYSDAGYPLPYYFPDRAEIHYDIWHDPRESAEDCVREVEDYVLGMCRLDTWLRDHPPRFEWVRYYPPLETGWDDPIARTMRSAHERAGGAPIQAPSPQSPVNFAAACDATWLQAQGIPSVVFGPGDVRIAHGKDEYIELSEIEAAARSLALAVLEWCGCPS